MHESWERQRRELDSYNTFFSAITGEVTNEGFHELGFRYVGRFQRIRDERTGVQPAPDFVLYNGRILLLAEVKSGWNINPGHVEQMEECDEVSIEAAREFLDATPIESEGLDPGSLTEVQPFIVYYEDFIEECREQPACADALDELLEVTAVATQRKGGSLQLEGGVVYDDGFGERLADGISLPSAPPKNVFLTEGMEPECLAFSVCYDLVLNSLGTGRVTLFPSDVANHYLNRELPLSRVERVLEFLNDAGACRSLEGGGYEFTRGHLRNIVGIEEKLAEKPVDEWLGEEAGEDGQSSIGDFL